MSSFNPFSERCLVSRPMPLESPDLQWCGQQSVYTQQIIEEVDHLYDVVAYFAQLTNHDYQALHTTAATMRTLSCNLYELVARSKREHAAPTKIGSFPNHPCDF